MSISNIIASSVMSNTLDSSQIVALKNMENSPFGGIYILLGATKCCNFLQAFLI